MSKFHSGEVIETAIIWRGSITDVATDIAYLIDQQLAHQLIAELTRFINYVPDKFQGKGFK